MADCEIIAKNRSYQYAGVSAFQNVFVDCCWIIVMEMRKVFWGLWTLFLLLMVKAIITIIEALIYNSQTESLTEIIQFTMYCICFLLFIRSFSNAAVSCMQNMALVAHNNQHYICLFLRVCHFTRSGIRLDSLLSSIFNNIITSNVFLFDWRLF